MIINLEQLQDSLDRMQDMHVNHAATGYCIECHNPWPCDTSMLLTSAATAFEDVLNNQVELTPAEEIGKVLSKIESRFTLEGPRAHEVISRLHYLLLEHGVIVTGSLTPFAEYCVSVATGPDTVQRLWQIVLAGDVIVQIFAPTGRAANDRFLSQVLMESFSPRDADQVVAWWDNNNNASMRELSLSYDDAESLTKSILMLIDATIRYNDSVRIEQYTE